MEWISVKEYLPEVPKGSKSIQVIVNIKDCDNYTVTDCMYGDWGKNNLYGECKENCFFELYYGNEIIWGPVFDNVTHWMYFPNPIKD
jgi:hypothetical protein